MTDLDQVVAGNAAAEFLKNNSGDYLPSFKFTNINDTVAGQITRVQVVAGTDLKGNPQQSLVVELVDPASGEGFAVWIPNGKPKMVNATLAACREAGVSQPMVGDLMRVTFSGETPATKPGYNPSKDYEVKYKRGGAATPTPAPTPAKPAADSII